MPAASTVRRNALVRLDATCGTPVAKVSPTFVCREAGPTSPSILGKVEQVGSAFPQRGDELVDAHKSVARSVIDVREPLERIEAVADLIEQCAHQREPTQVPSR